jgi:dCMP deaminase
MTQEELERALQEAEAEAAPLPPHWRGLTPQVPTPPREPEAPAPLVRLEPTAEDASGKARPLSAFSVPLTQTPPRVRPSWDDYFLGIAAQVAERSTCDRLSVGAVLVRDKVILSTVYIGSARGVAHCDDIGHLMHGAENATQIVKRFFKRFLNGNAEQGLLLSLSRLDHCVRTVHAEANAIAQAARQGTRIDSSTCYVTHSPCFECAKVLVNAGVARVVYSNDYRVESGALGLLREAGVCVGHIR